MFFRCSSENVIEIKGIYLDLPWKKDYNDTTTVEFKELAAEMSYKLFTLIQFQHDNHQILGSSPLLLLYLTMATCN